MLVIDDWPASPPNCRSPDAARRRTQRRPNPYQARRDEVGDAARAANIFKDNLLRMQELRGEKRTVVEEARRSRHAALPTNLSTVGAIVSGVPRNWRVAARQNP